MPNPFQSSRSLDGPRRLAAECDVDASLHDGKQGLGPLAVEGVERGTAAGQPADATFARVARGGGVTPARDHVVELHHDVAAQVPLDLHDRFGGEAPARAVEVALEVHAVLVHRAQRSEREDLEATGVGEDGAVPLHEAVETAQLPHQLVARPQVQVVGVGENHLRAHGPQVVRVERFDGGQGPHRHERRRLHDSVRRGECAGAGSAELGDHRKPERI